MDIFSVTSKQVETATTPKAVSATDTAATRPVEQTADTSKVNEPSKEDKVKSLTKTVKDLNDQMDMLNTNITFGFNDKIDVMYVNVMEKSTGKVIRKFPTDEAMNLSEKMKEIVGIIFDKKG